MQRSQYWNQMEFLGMIIDSTSQQLRVPGLKIKKLRQECKAILEAAVPPPARTVARMVGKTNAMVQAIVPAPLFFQSLQRDLSRTLDMSCQYYDHPCTLSGESQEWWTSNLKEWNSRCLIAPEPDFYYRVRCLPNRLGASSQGSRTGVIGTNQRRICT